MPADPDLRLRRHARGDPGPGRSARRPTAVPGPGRPSPANRVPRPTPGSSATKTRSAGPPPSGAGPAQATAVARTPVRSSPAQATPVSVQPGGSGHGHHSGVTGGSARSRRSGPPRSPRSPAPMCSATCSGGTGPQSHAARVGVHQIRRPYRAPASRTTHRDTHIPTVVPGSRAGTSSRNVRHSAPGGRDGQSGGGPACGTDPGVHGDAAGHAGVDRPGRAVLGDGEELVAGGPGRRGEAGALLAEQQHAAPGQGAGLQRHASRAGCRCRPPAAAARPPRRRTPRSSRGAGRAGTGRSPSRRAGSTVAVRRCAPRRRGTRWRCGPPCRC